MGRRPPSRIGPNTAEEKSAVIIERDLSLLTGEEILKKYGDVTSPAGLMFNRVTGKEAESFTGHNPFWHYLLAVWFDNPDGRAMISEEHRLFADDLLAFMLGGYDEKDGFVCGQPRRSLKSTFVRAACDWAAKRFWYVDHLDLFQIYFHNQHDEAMNAGDSIKNKNRSHKYIAKHFDRFKIPVGEWGKREYWDWPCRKEGDSVSDPQMRFLPIKGKKAGKGAHFRWLDDVEDEDSRDSEVIRKQISDDYDQQRQLEAPAFSRECLVDTPYHLYGLTLTLKEAKRESTGETRYQVRWRPALTEQDEPVFPNIRKLTVDGLAKERANEMARTGTDAFWYLQYMLDPRLTGTQAMQWEWFLPMSVAEHRLKWSRLPHFRCVFVDSAWKGTEKQGKGDSTAIEVVDLYNFSNPDGSQRMERILLEGVVSREMVSDEGALEMCRLMKKWGTYFYCIEQNVEKTFDGTMRAVSRNLKPPFRPHSIDLKGWTKKAKGFRVSAVAGDARMGYIHYLDTVDPSFLNMMRREVADYPENKVSPNILDCFANSFADAVIRAWVPMTQDPGIFQDPEPVPIPISRYTGLYAVQ